MNMPINPVAAGTTANPMMAGASPAATAASPLGGFEALLAALFGGEGQVASPFAKTVQPADGDAPAEGLAEGETPPATDPTAAHILLAAFAMAPAPAAPIAAAPTSQGEAESVAGAVASNVQALGAATIPAQSAPEQGAVAQTVAAGAFPASTGASANAPGPEAAAPAASGAAPAQSAKGEPLPQASLPDVALQVPPEADAAPASQSQPAPPPSQLAAAAATMQQSLQPPAAPNAPADKAGAAPAQTSDTQTASVTGEDGAKPAIATAGAAAPKPPGTPDAPGLRKLERVDASVQSSAPPADVASPSTHAQAPAEAAPSGAASAHATATHVASVRGAPETVATLAAEILKKLDSRTTRFDMELEPLGLGKVDVRLEIGAHGRLTAAMAFENPQSAQELKNRSGELMRALEQAGFDVTDGLSFDVADNSNGSGQNNGAQEQGRDAPWRGRAFLAALETAGAADAPPIATMNLARLRASGVDIKI
jgi:flagellar hook-length control protein FliK